MMYLQIEQLAVSYPNSPSPAVAGVSLGLAAGEIGVLIGPSGCGKTTLLRAVAGLEPASVGSITIASRMVSGFAGSGSGVDSGAAGTYQHTAPEDRRIGMVFQDYALFPHLDVARNVGFGLRHLPKSERKPRVLEVLELVGLAGQQHQYPHQLSGGQQQRVALARALAPKPALLLLDEPFSNLDVELRERLAHEVRGILKAAGTTALLVTHDQLEAFAVGDTIGVMESGVLHQWADAYTLYHRPSTRFVADFIGHGVFATAKVENHLENGVLHKHVVTPLGELHDISPDELERLPIGECEVLLRADDIIHDDASPVQAQIIRKAFRGSEFLYTLQLKTGETVLAHVPSHHDHKLGEWIGIRPEVDHVVTFAKTAPA
jgi:iron(III) transport system ATP-binding protein